MHHLHVFFESTALTFVLLLFVGMLLVFIGGLQIICRAPGLDIVVSLFTWVPWAIGFWRGHSFGLAGTIVGQVAALYAWCWLHETMHPAAARGPRINNYIDKLVGRWRNHLALWATSIAVPGFWVIRLMELLCYAPLVWLLNFPKYKQSEWVMVSRQKFEGLVGHDLVWCLYCDWMTGVFSLGAEMLRNVESFWCPIRFYDGKKCDNCKVDFPDLDNGWVGNGGTMADVQNVLKEKYADGQRAWFGHPARLTVKGQPLSGNTDEPRSNEATKEETQN